MNVFNLFIKVSPLALIIGVVSGSLVPLAPVHADVDSISINSITVPGCGPQVMTFSGSGTYSEPTQHVVVKLDGVVILTDTSEPASWITGAQSISVGNHTIVATIYDKSDLADVMAQDTKSFEVVACGSGSSSGSSASSGSGSGDEKDCCPGPDPVTSTKISSKGKVKGTKSAVKVSGKLPASLIPLNGIFNSVYHRDPTFQEWTYWANQFLTNTKYKDKGQYRYDALLGAMQWQKMHGRTMGL